MHPGNNASLWQGTKPAKPWYNGFNAALSLIVKSALPGDNAYAGAKLKLDRSEAGRLALAF